MHLWRGINIFPTWIVDQYTGFEVGWALTSPLLHLGGPLLGRRLFLETVAIETSVMLLIEFCILT